MALTIFCTTFGSASALSIKGARSKNVSAIVRLWVGSVGCVAYLVNRVIFYQKPYVWSAARFCMKVDLLASDKSSYLYLSVL